MVERTDSKSSEHSDLLIDISYLNQHYESFRSIVEDHQSFDSFNPISVESSKLNGSSLIVSEAKINANNENEHCSVLNITQTSAYAQNVTDRHSLPLSPSITPPILSPKSVSTESSMRTHSSECFYVPSDESFSTISASNQIGEEFEPKLTEENFSSSQSLTFDSDMAEYEIKTERESITEQSVVQNAEIFNQSNDQNQMKTSVLHVDTKLANIQSSIRQEQSLQNKTILAQKILSMIREDDYEQFVSTLRFAKPDLNIFINGQTALHYCLLMGRDVSWCKTLVLNGANPNLSNQDGWHPLHLAAFRGLKESVHYLNSCNEDCQMHHQNLEEDRFKSKRL
ncbi:hypothetical protein NH340_JMT02349 [Sarcoptes scabiei]|nr:hypothetical protein NH340_JMT02349 [Sarcoptes scabiei]